MLCGEIHCTIREVPVRDNVSSMFSMLSVTASKRPVRGELSANQLKLRRVPGGRQVWFLAMMPATSLISSDQVLTPTSYAYETPTCNNAGRFRYLPRRRIGSGKCTVRRRELRILQLTPRKFSRTDRRAQRHLLANCRRRVAVIGWRSEQ